MSDGPAGPGTAVLDLARVSKDYRGLRPLRIDHLVVERGESLALLGFDEPMAEVFINLVTGAAVPDQGDVRVFGRATSTIDSSAEWLQLVDRFGIVSHRAVLLEPLTVVQNLAMPFTLDVEPPRDDVRARAEALALEVGIGPTAWTRPVSELDPIGRVRVRLGRALALDPAIVLLEHSSAGIPSASVRPLAAEIRTIAHRRGASSIALTADESFAGAVADRVLRLEPASGRLSPRRRGWW